MDLADWQERVARLWASFGDRSGDDFLATMETLVAERPADDPAALYEHASAFDSTGHEDRAAPLYRRALAQGLPGQLRRRATIQLASTLRNLGQAGESVALLTTELATGSDDLDDAVRAFLALALASAGREREGVAMALAALAPHLTRYNRSLAAYARELA